MKTNWHPAFPTRLIIRRKPNLLYRRKIAQAVQCVAVFDKFFLFFYSRIYKRPARLVHVDDKVPRTIINPVFDPTH